MEGSATITSDIGPDDLNALGIIVTSLCSLVLTLVFGRRPERAWWKSLLGGLGLCFVFTLIFTISVHGCGAGTALTQWALPALGAVSIWIFARPVWLRWTGPAILFVIAVLLTFNHTGLVHRRDLTGNPEWDRQLAEHEQEDARLGIAHQLTRAVEEHGDRTFPAGWLRESETAALAPDSLLADAVRAGDHELAVTRRWHTWLTGIFRVSYPEASPRHDLWYPGGPLSTTAERIEYRPRPAAASRPR